jgi:hypothetical protein
VPNFDVEILAGDDYALVAGQTTRTVIEVVDRGQQGPPGATVNARLSRTAGLAIYVPDSANNREQFIYGDTGVRDVQNLFVAGVTASYARLSRVGSQCFLTINNMTTPDAFAAILPMPAGFEATDGPAFGAFREIVNTGAFVQYQIAGGTLYATGKPANPVATWRWSGTISWHTASAWPNTLPGAKVSDPPNA